MKNILSILLLLPLLALGQSSTQNYVKTTTYKQGTTVGFFLPTPAQIKVDVTYLDGLGRPIQQVASKQSATGKDIVTPIVYDSYGRQTKDYLPFPSESTTMGFVENTAIIASLESFYGTAYGTEGGNPFSEKRLEASPLNRILEQGAPGTPWTVNLSSGQEYTHTIKLDYSANTEEIVYLKATASSPSAGVYAVSISNTGTYKANQLYKTVTKNENWASGIDGTVEEFKDQQGRVVLKRTYASGFKHATNYVYDQFGNLAYVLPPSAGIRTSNEILDELCYQYKYDHRNRLVEKKLPGKQWEFIVYDKLDRVVATGPTDAPFSDMLPQRKGWLITKYDALGRVLLTGWKEATFTATTRKSLQDLYNSKTIFSESRTAGLTTINGVGFKYTNLAEPVAGYHVLTINYYDDYDFPAPTDTEWVPTALPTASLGQAVYYNRTLKPRSLATGSWVRVLESSTAYRNERSYMLYDVKARPILASKRNHLGGYDLSYTLYDFEGKVLQTQTEHKRLDTLSPLTVNDYFTYTNQGKLLQHKHKVNNLAEELMSRNEYDVLGQLITKRVGGAATGTGLQKVDYSYNIRGWLKGINDVGNLNQGGGAPNDLFAFKIAYNDGFNSLYNGNISETWWITASDNTQRKYDYYYDALDRLATAYYRKPAHPEAFGAYDEWVDYDLNGNIQFISRNGYLDADNGSTYLIDELYYTYAPNSNKLMKIVDSTNSWDGFKDGQNPESGKPDYDYDANGNMVYDWNKGIEEIRYNHLNLPVKIKFKVAQGEKNIEYLYNAEGVKLGKKILNNSPVGEAVNSLTEYFGGFQYKDNLLQFFPTAEGYVSVAGSSYNYVFNYTDHLGNIRLSYSKPSNGSLTIMDENHYYPFGMKHTNYGSQSNEYVLNPDRTPMYAELLQVANNKYQYKYNGKEYQDELSLNWYDYGARNYDPAIGRWMNIDPLAETSRRFSPYTYALNNPIRFIDPDGMEADDFRINYKDKDGNMQEFVFDGGATALPDSQFVRDFVGAYNHNVGNGGGDSMKAIAENGNIMVDVQEGEFNGQDNSLNGDYNVITWNSSQGIETTNGNVLSPATLLEHESGHALAGATNPGAKLGRVETTDKNYENKEEKRVITGTEQKTAMANREISVIGTTRNDHNGLPVVTKSPTSNTVDRPKTYQFLKAKHSQGVFFPGFGAKDTEKYKK